MKSTVYLILFRGVGGKTQLPTKPLREFLTAAGFENVSTYINSGNAIVRSRLKREKVIETIAGLCREHFAFDKAIFAPTLAEWDHLIARNPFAKAAAAAPTTVHAALLMEKPQPENIGRVRSFAVPGEELEVIGGVAYLHTPHGLENPGWRRVSTKRSASPTPPAIGTPSSGSPNSGGRRWANSMHHVPGFSRPDCLSNRSLGGSATPDDQPNSGPTSPRPTTT